MMSGGWTMGTPRSPRGSSEVVEVTDGDRRARAWCSFARKHVEIVPVVPVWFDESGAALTWQPTHWRLVASGATRAGAHEVE